jgi:hypothetical protein
LGRPCVVGAVQVAPTPRIRPRGVPRHGGSVQVTIKSLSINTASEQLAARVAGHAHCPVLLRTLHIGGANLKSRATRDSTVPPRSHTDFPARTCRIHREHCCKLQAEAIRGLQPRSDRNDCDVSARTCHRRRRFQTHACGCLRDACIPNAVNNEHAACRLASRRAQDGRGRPVLRVTCEHPDVRLPSARCRIWRERFDAHSRSMPVRDQTKASLRLDGRGLPAPCASLPPPLRCTSRGRMRGVGATCTAPTTQGRPKTHGKPLGYCKFGAGCTQRRRRSVRSFVCAATTVARGLASTATGPPLARDRGRTHYRDDFRTLQPLWNAPTD